MRVGGVGLGEEPVFDKSFEADQQGITCKRGKALIRRVAIAGWSKRQHLPQSLSGRREQVDELERAGAEISNAEAARQRCRVKKHAARARERHRTPNHK